MSDMSTRTFAFSGARVVDGSPWLLTCGQYHRQHRGKHLQIKINLRHAQMCNSFLTYNSVVSLWSPIGNYSYR